MSRGPTLDERIKGHRGYGLVLLFDGHGKGKTTAGLGTAVRARGGGKRVAIVYFDKGGETHYSERKLLGGLGIDWWATGRDRIDPKTGRFDFSITEEDRAEASRGLQKTRDIFLSSAYDLVILDEINSTTSLGMLDEGDVLDVLGKKPTETELIMTGRDAPESFKNFAHLVTEMVLKKHYFYSGVQAREGIDY